MVRKQVVTVTFTIDWDEGQSAALPAAVATALASLGLPAAAVTVHHHPEWAAWLAGVPAEPYPLWRLAVGAHCRVAVSHDPRLQDLIAVLPALGADDPRTWAVQALDHLSGNDRFTREAVVIDVVSAVLARYGATLGQQRALVRWIAHSSQDVPA